LTYPIRRLAGLSVVERRQEDPITGTLDHPQAAKIEAVINRAEKARELDKSELRGSVGVH
jgi:hypothetical protein